jgi:RNA polymerase sigma-70 factor (ECF subfamily)
VDKAELDSQFSELYKAHLRDVYSYSYYRVGNHHDAEDLTEQTFLQAYRHFERAQRESDGRPLRPWLIRIAHNLAANLYRDRARKPQTPIEDTTVLSAPHTTEDLVEGRDELARILEGVKELPDDRRDALRPGHGQSRDRTGHGPHGRRHQGADPSCDQAARADRRHGRGGELR